MKSVYNSEWLLNLTMVKDAKSWMKAGFITRDQFDLIATRHPSGFFHPNLMIRILLFIATLIALSGVSGLLALMVSDADEASYPFLITLYGVASFFVLDKIFIRRMKHYKSGVTEALIYHSTAFVVAGVVWFADASVGISLAFSAMFCALVAYRYHDLVLTATAVICGCCFLFYEFDQLEGARQIIPLAFILVFSLVYFAAKKIKQNESSFLWDDCVIVVEALSLLVIYAAGNYFVVRELSEGMMGMYLEEGQDIPLAFLFYALTIFIPILYLFFGIQRRDIVLLRVSLFVLAFSAFTFKYYFSVGHPEITLTAAGAILIITAVVISRYLKVQRKGFTREQLLTEKWADANPEAFVISQTLGGNQVAAADSSFNGGGGEFGGGGASGTY
jgi:uncharacterized membrane protein YgcG